MMSLYICIPWRPVARAVSWGLEGTTSRVLLFFPQKYTPARWGPGTAVQELWIPHPWKCPQPQMGPGQPEVVGGTQEGGGKGLGLDGLQGPLQPNHSVVLWLHGETELLDSIPDGLPLLGDHHQPCPHSPSLCPSASHSAVVLLGTYGNLCCRRPWNDLKSQSFSHVLLHKVLKFYLLRTTKAHTLVLMAEVWSW